MKPTNETLRVIRTYCLEVQCKWCVFGKGTNESADCRLISSPPYNWNLEEGEADGALQSS